MPLLFNFPFQNYSQDSDIQEDKTKTDKLFSKFSDEDVNSVLNSVVAEKRKPDSLSVEVLKENKNIDKYSKEAENILNSVVASEEVTGIENISKARRIRYGAAQEQTVLENTYQAAKAWWTQKDYETYRDALAREENNRQTEIFKKYPKFQGREEDGYVLAGRFGKAMIDPVYFAIPWTRVAQASRLASVGLSGTVSAADYALRDKVLYGEVDKNYLALSFALGAGGGYLGDSLAQFLNPSRTRLNSQGEELSRKYGVGEQQLLDFGEETMEEFAPLVNRITKVSNEQTALLIQRKNIYAQIEELKITLSDTAKKEKLAKDSRQLDLFPDSKNVKADTKPAPAAQEISKLQTQYKKINKKLNELRKAEIEDRGIIGFHSLYKAWTTGTITDQNWGRTKGLAQALIQESVRPAAYAFSGGVTGVYMADDSVETEDDTYFNKLWKTGAILGLMHKRVLNYKGGRLTPTLKSKILKSINKEAETTYRHSARYFAGRFLIPATTQSSRLSFENPIMQRFNLMFFRNLGTKLRSDKVVPDSVEEMTDQVFQNFSLSLIKIFNGLDDNTLLTAGRLIQNNNHPSASKFTFLEKGDLNNAEAVTAFRKYTVLQNRFKEYMKDTGLKFNEDPNYGLTQLFVDKTKNKKETLDILVEAFKIQYKNNKSSIDKKLKQSLSTEKEISTWAKKMAAGYLQGADPSKRELAMSAKALEETVNVNGMLNKAGQPLNKSQTIISTSRFLENERVLFDPEARAFAKNLFVQDPLQTTLLLYKNIIPIAEFAKAFGPRGERINSLRKQLVDYYKPMDKENAWGVGHKAYDAYKLNLKQISDSVNAHFKVLDIDGSLSSNQNVINAMHTLTALTSTTNLTKVVIPSMGDILQTIKNSGVKAAWKSTLLQIQQNAINKGIDALKPSAVLNSVERTSRKNRKRWKGSQYGNNGTMESVLQDSTQRITGDSPYQEKLYLYQKAFFELVQLGRVTRFAREFAYDAGAYRGYDLARKLVTKGKLSRSERRELSYLGMDLEDAKKVGSFNDMDNAFDNFETRKFIEKAGQRSADRDALIPQLGNRRLFSQSNNPLIRGAGMFLSWTQAKAAQTSALLARVEDGDVRLLIRTVGVFPIYAAVRQLALAASTSTSYRDKYSVDIRLDSNSMLDISGVYGPRDFAKVWADTFMFAGESQPWYTEKVVKLLEPDSASRSGTSGPIDQLYPPISTINKVYDAGMQTAAGNYWTALVDGSDAIVAFSKDFTGTKPSENILFGKLSSLLFQDQTMDQSIRVRAERADVDRLRQRPLIKNFKGGLQVANAVDNPKDRINPYTGEPYAVTAGVSLLDILERRNLLNTTPRMPFGVGSLVSSLLKPKQNDFLVGQIDKAVSKFDDMLKEKNWSVGDVKANTKFKLKTDEVVEEGQLIDARRNLNSRSKDKTSKVMEHPNEAARPKINTIHKSSGKNRFGKGEAATYDAAVVTQGNNELGVDQILRHEIATEAISKTPMAAVRGKYTSKILTPENLKADDLREILKRASTVFGFNPKMFNTFVDFESGLAIKSFNGIAVTLDTQVFAILKNPTKFKDVVIDDKMVRLYDDIEYYTPETIPKYQDAFNALNKTQQQTHTKTLQNAKVALDDAGLFRTGKTVPTDILNKFKDSLFKEGDLKTPFKKVTPENYNSLFGGFQTDATLLAYPKYAALKGKKIDIVDMTPDEYIKESAKLFNTSPKMLEKNRIENTAGFGGQELIDKLKNSMKQIMEGKKLKLGNDEYDSFAPVALYANKQQEGLHRAIAAKQLGIKKIPVIVEKNIKRVDQGAGYNYFKEADRVEYNKGNLVNRLQQRNMYG